MSENPVKPPSWYWIVSILALLWNLLGTFVFAVMVLMVSGKLNIASEEAVANMDETQRAQMLVTQEVILAKPMWCNVAFAAAVGFGVPGSVALLMRKKVAIPFFLISLVGVLVQNSYDYLLSDAVEKIGVGMSPMVILVAILMVPFAYFGGQRDWIK